jgi:hypothetical protein
MNDLERFFEANTDRLIHKWRHYFEIYDRHFARFRGQSPHVVEFGVSQGGSMRMWKDYFGAGATIHGVDINPHCKQFEEDGVHITSATRKIAASCASSHTHSRRSTS